jgi:cellulose synthase/poly-beta-1,6-N-acetylglucosamine synthase-like glycosyltransferase
MLHKPRPQTPAGPDGIPPVQKPLRMERCRIMYRNAKFVHKGDDPSMNDLDRSAADRIGVSVVTCTNRPRFVGNLIRNFVRQRHAKKELILVVHHDRIPLSHYLQRTAGLRDVRIYRMPACRTLGACLNKAVGMARYDIVAKFDDDDYYAPDYLTDSLLTLLRSNADVVGKRAHYMYLRGSRTLILRFPNGQYRDTSRLPGATLMFRRKVFDQVRFPDRSVGEDDVFCLRSRRKGFKVYSGNKYHFVAVRRKNASGHTWTISDRELIAKHRVIPGVRDYKTYVQRTPKGWSS